MGFMGSRGGGGFNRSGGRFGGPSSFSQPQAFGGSQQFGGSRAGGGGQSQLGTPRQSFEGGAEKKPSSQYSGFVRPEKSEDQFEGGDGSTAPPSTTPTNFGMSRSFSTPSMRHPYSGSRFPGNSGPRMSGRSNGSGEGGGPIRAGIRGRGARFGGGSGRPGSSTSTANDNFSSITAATAAAARATREARNPNAKCVVLATGSVHLSKFKCLVDEIKKLKTKRPNAIDTIHSAANIAHLNIQSEIESGPIVRGTGTFFCLVQFDGINISVSSGLNKRASKVEAFEMALQKLMKPFQRIVEIDGTSKELQASDCAFSAEDPKQTVIKPMSSVVANISGEGGGDINSFQKESNVEAIVDIKKKNYVPKEIHEFVLVEPQDHNTSVNGASILRRSADFSKMLLEYDFAAYGTGGAVRRIADFSKMLLEYDFAAYGTGGAVRCVLKLEGKVLADIIAHSKMASKIEASQKAVDVLRGQCWTILTKQVYDSSGPEITKDEMFDDLASCFTSNTVTSMSIPIADSNKGKKLLQKMGWTGGGIGKDGAGIEEPVQMKQVINREGLGLDAKRGISADFCTRIMELLENYAASERQDDLVFSPHFRKDERIIIHNECRRLNLKSKSSGQGHTRYLIVRRKRSAYQLLDHVMRCGGETARYKVAPPGERRYPWKTAVSVTNSLTGPSKLLPPGAHRASTPSLSSSASAQAKQGLLAEPMLGVMAQNLAAGMLAQMGSAMAQNGPRGMMGQNSGMMGQNAGMMGQQNSGMMGQNPGMMAQNSGMNSGMMGQNSGMMGQQNSGMMGQQNSGMMGQNSGMMGPRGAVGMARSSSAGVMVGNIGIEICGQVDSSYCACHIVGNIGIEICGQVDSSYCACHIVGNIGIEICGQVDSSYCACHIVGNIGIEICGQVDSSYCACHIVGNIGIEICGQVDSSYCACHIVGNIGIEICGQVDSSYCACHIVGNIGIEICGQVDSRIDLFNT
ncbi:hypothetical protein ACOMHN_001584 [Nucella lapillus]